MPREHTESDKLAGLLEEQAALRARVDQLERLVLSLLARPLPPLLPWPVSFPIVPLTQPPPPLHPTCEPIWIGPIPSTTVPLPGVPFILSTGETLAG